MPARTSWVNSEHDLGISEIPIDGQAYQERLCYWRCSRLTRCSTVYGETRDSRTWSGG